MHTWPPVASIVEIAQVPHRRTEGRDWDDENRVVQGAADEQTACMVIQGEEQGGYDGVVERHTDVVCEVFDCERANGEEWANRGCCEVRRVCK